MCDGERESEKERECVWVSLRGRERERERERGGKAHYPESWNIEHDMKVRLHRYVS